MAALAPLPPLPAQFKSIQHHLRTAQEHDKRDPVVAYYCESLRVAALPDGGCPSPRAALGVTSNTVQPSPQTVPAIDPDLYTASQGDVRLTPEDFARAQKYCKYAGSALQYEDVGTAVQNLQKALRLLTTGRE
ncbi:vacuolar protein sorting-associated protein VTA1 homolog [Peromyscus eremicus]|uniref:vacuolar protein sorting-associated protein VTA1 homolog n=1 Tax=Peromyscus eremicus TaxID=42410 RepID=UPI0027DBB6E8|nr:vacuolar protein sorting-associated protein VTA1 homolog [Peromyscus eremicus]